MNEKLQKLRAATEVYLQYKLEEIKKEQADVDEQVKQAKSLGQPIYKDHWMRLYRLKGQVSGARRFLSIIDEIARDD